MAIPLQKGGKAAKAPFYPASPSRQCPAGVAPPAAGVAFQGLLGVSYGPLGASGTRNLNPEP